VDARDEFADHPISEELIGLDPDDPETMAFAEHLARMRGPGNNYTVEGYLQGVGEFANSVNRIDGHRRLMAVILICLMLFGGLYAAWETLTLVFSTFGP
jgi:hypothetical protein